MLLVFALDVVPESSCSGSLYVIFTIGQLVEPEIPKKLMCFVESSFTLHPKGSTMEKQSCRSVVRERSKWSARSRTQFAPRFGCVSQRPGF